MKILLTQEHIANGVRFDCHNCAIALAIGDVVKDPKSVTVGLAAIRVGGMKFLTSPEIADFMDRFDGEKKVKPFEFELDLPQSMVK